MLIFKFLKTLNMIPESLLFLIRVFPHQKEHLFSVYMLYARKERAWQHVWSEEEKWDLIAHRWKTPKTV